MTEAMKAHCPRCDGERNCDIQGAFSESWDYETIHGENVHRLLRCMGCETVFYHVTCWDSEDWTVEWDEEGKPDQVPLIRTETYPAPVKEGIKPDWAWSLAKIDPLLDEIMTEIYRARDDGNLILPVVGLRTAFDRVTEVLGIHPALSFEQKIAKVREQGFVGDAEAEVLRVVVDAGNAAAHRGWRPEPENFTQLLAALEHFIQRAVIAGTAVLAVGQTIPKKQTLPRKPSGAAQ